MNYPVFTDFFEEIINTGNNPIFKFSQSDLEITIGRKEFRHHVLCLAKTIFEKYGQKNKIALLGENSYQWICLFFAIVLSSNTAVLLDKDGSYDSNTQRLKIALCQNLIYSDTYHESASKLLESSSSFSSILPSENELTMSPIASDDIICILFTSGTTGVSKAVPLSSENIVSDSVTGSSLTELTGVNLLVLPLHHGYGLVSAMLSPIHRGGTVYIGKGPRRIISDLKLSEPDYLFAIPAMIKMITSQLERMGKPCDLRAIFGKNLKTIVCGSAPNPKSMFEMFKSQGIELNCGYGITECSPMVTANRSGNVFPESVGIPLECNEVKISKEGEVLVRGRNVFKGYLNNDAANKEAFTEDGWFCTGDLGMFGENGELYITGRKKNLIILSNGENISPEPLENAINALPYVSEVLVFEKDDKITAKVYLDPSFENTLKQEIKKINSSFPLNSRIGNIIISNEPLPKTSTGKILRPIF